MGYDSRVYIIRKTDVPSGKEGFKYAETMAIYEMGVFPLFQTLFGKGCPETEYCPCIGDEEIVEDMYGDPLRERSLIDVINRLDHVIVSGEDGAYKRIRPLLALLQEFRNIEDSWYRLAVLHYGH
jgi:hypothetical protein